MPQTRLSGSMRQTQSQSQTQTQTQSQSQQVPLFAYYARHLTAWDELFATASQPHPHCRPLVECLGRLLSSEFQQRRASADLVFVNQGITFSVYSDRRGVEKIFPFDLIPRPIASAEWARLEAGLLQRITRLNLFLHDVYHDQRILKEGIVPADLVLGSKSFRKEMVGFEPPQGQYLHIVGTDLVRDPTGTFLVLEDNGRTPSGVSYVLENRVVMKKVFPQLFQHCRVRRVEDYPQRLRQALCSVAPAGAGDPPCLVLLSPGPYNSAYFEHSFLARHMGIELVLGQDLFVQDDKVYLKTTRGAAASGRDLPPARRRLPRPGDVPARQSARRAGAVPRLPSRQRHPGQRRRHRRRRRQGDLPLRGGHDSLLPVRGADPAQCADVYLCPSQGPEFRARPPR